MRKTVLVICLGLFILVGCADSGISFETLPEGDATRGERIYTESINGAPSCSSCHSLTDERLVGPGFAAYSELAATRIEGQSVAEYTYQAITNPAAHLVEGYANVMYAQYRIKLSEQDIADIIAFLLAQ